MSLSYNADTFGSLYTKYVRVKGIYGGDSGNGVQRSVFLSALNDPAINNNEVTLTLSHNDTALPTFSFSEPTSIVNVAAPSADLHAANKQYVDNVAKGLSFKDSVRAATTGNVPNTGSGSQLIFDMTVNPTGGVEITGASTITVDGVTLDSTEPALDRRRVLVKSQTNAVENGIYTLTAVNQGGLTITLDRSPDMDEDANAHGFDEVKVGAFCFIEGGATHGGQGWVVSNTDSVTKEPTINTHTLTWTQFSTADTIVGLNGIDVTGSQISVDLGASTILGFNGIGSDKLHLQSSATPGEVLVSGGTATVDPLYGVAFGRNDALVTLNPMAASGTGAHGNEVAGGGLQLSEPYATTGDYSQGVYFGEASTAKGTIRHIARRLTDESGDTTGVGTAIYTQQHDPANNLWRTLCVVASA